MRYALTLLAASVLAPFTTANADSADAVGHDILSVAQAAGNFTTLTKAIEAAGLTQLLQKDGPMTVFAPTDEAFAKLPAADLQALMEPGNKDKLVSILGLHVVPNAALDSETLKRRSTADTVSGEVDVELRRGRLRVGEARILADDIKASNGIIHSIDRVILPAG